MSQTVLPATYGIFDALIDALEFDMLLYSSRRWLLVSKALNDNF